MFYIFLPNIFCTYKKKNVNIRLTKFIVIYGHCLNYLFTIITKYEFHNVYILYMNYNHLLISHFKNCCDRNNAKKLSRSSFVSPLFYQKAENKKMLCNQLVN